MSHSKRRRQQAKASSAARASQPICAGAIAATVAAVADSTTEATSRPAAPQIADSTKLLFLPLSVKFKKKRDSGVENDRQSQPRRRSRSLPNTTSFEGYEAGYPRAKEDKFPAVFGVDDVDVADYRRSDDSEDERLQVWYEKSRLRPTLSGQHSDPETSATAAIEATAGRRLRPPRRPLEYVDVSGDKKWLDERAVEPYANYFAGADPIFAAYRDRKFRSFMRRSWIRHTHQLAYAAWEQNRNENVLVVERVNGPRDLLAHLRLGFCVEYAGPCLANGDRCASYCELCSACVHEYHCSCRALKRFGWCRHTHAATLFGRNRFGSDKVAYVHFSGRQMQLAHLRASCYDPDASVLQISLHEFVVTHAAGCAAASEPPIRYLVKRLPRQRRRKRHAGQLPTPPHNSACAKCPSYKKCPECEICRHAYQCSCVSYTVDRRLCEHCHVLAIHESAVDRVFWRCNRDFFYATDDGAGTDQEDVAHWRDIQVVQLPNAIEAHHEMSYGYSLAAIEPGYKGAATYFSVKGRKARSRWLVWWFTNQTGCSCVLGEGPTVGCPSCTTCLHTLLCECPVPREKLCEHKHLVHRFCKLTYTPILQPQYEEECPNSRLTDERLLQARQRRRLRRKKLRKRNATRNVQDILTCRLRGEIDSDDIESRSTHCADGEEAASSSGADDERLMGLDEWLKLKSRCIPTGRIGEENYGDEIHQQITRCGQRGGADGGAGSSAEDVGAAGLDEGHESEMSLGQDQYSNIRDLLASKLRRENLGAEEPGPDKGQKLVTSLSRGQTINTRKLRAENNSDDFDPESEEAGGSSRVAEEVGLGGGRKPNVSNGRGRRPPHNSCPDICPLDDAPVTRNPPATKKSTADNCRVETADISARSEYAHSKVSPVATPLEKTVIEVEITDVPSSNVLPENLTENSTSATISSGCVKNGNSTLKGSSVSTPFEIREIELSAADTPRQIALPQKPTKDSTMEGKTPRIPDENENLRSMKASPVFALSAKSEIGVNMADTSCQTAPSPENPTENSVIEALHISAAGENSDCKASSLLSQPSKESKVEVDVAEPSPLAAANESGQKFQSFRDSTDTIGDIQTFEGLTFKHWWKKRRSASAVVPTAEAISQAHLPAAVISERSTPKNEPVGVNVEASGRSECGSNHEKAVAAITKAFASERRPKVDRNYDKLNCAAAETAESERKTEAAVRAADKNVAELCSSPPSGQAVLFESDELKPTTRRCEAKNAADLDGETFAEDVVVGPRRTIIARQTGPPTDKFESVDQPTAEAAAGQPADGSTIGNIAADQCRALAAGRDIRAIEKYEPKSDSEAEQAAHSKIVAAVKETALIPEQFRLGMGESKSTRSASKVEPRTGELEEGSVEGGLLQSNILESVVNIVEKASGSTNSGSNSPAERGTVRETSNLVTESGADVGQRLEMAESGSVVPDQSPTQPAAPSQAAARPAPDFWKRMKILTCGASKAARP